MGFVSRDPSGRINGWARHQSPSFTEEMADDHPDVIAYLQEPAPAAGKVSVARERQQKLEALSDLMSRGAPQGEVINGILTYLKEHT